MRAVLVLALSACGSAPPASPPPPTALPPLPRSSIAAVLLHRDELGLDDEQVHAMQEIDEKLAEVNSKIAEGAPAAAARRAPADAGVSPIGGNVGGLHMGHGARGGGGGPRRAALPAPERHGTPTEERMDDNDTRAYLRAEQVMTEAQRERAREIAEEYRAALYDRRHPGEAPQ